MHARVCAGLPVEVAERFRIADVDGELLLSLSLPEDLKDGLDILDADADMITAGVTN